MVGLLDNEFDSAAATDAFNLGLFSLYSVFWLIILGRYLSVVVLLLDASCP